MSKDKNVIQRIEGEERDSYSDDSLFSISSWGADLSFRELIQRYEDNELVKPELQRHYVWDHVEASRFIDSLLLGLPVPSIFLSQTDDNRLLIVDGYQRILTVYDYVRGIFSTDGKVFRLSRSKKINPRWQGKAFKELAEAEQRRVRNTTIHSIIFVQKHPENDNTSLFQIFERINTSGRTLLPQEIRNCVAQGGLNRLLFELNDGPVWRKLFGLAEPDIRMRDMECILRFLALSSETFLQDERERISLKLFLDLYMKKNANPSEGKLEGFRDRFTKSLELIHEVFGVSAFHNISPKNPENLVPKFSKTIFDSITIAADHAICSGGYSIPEDSEGARRALLQDAEYSFAITQETMRRKSITTRIRKACKHLFGVEYE
jgi:uncharacterized protein DUF262